MHPELENKLAALLQHQIDVRLGYRAADTMMVNSLYNDPEILNWLHHMSREGRIKPIFTHAR